MSAVERNREVLEALDCGREVTVGEAIKKSCLQLGEELRKSADSFPQLGATRDAHLEFLGQFQPAVDDVLAVALPLVEYGEGRALDRLATAIEGSAALGWPESPPGGGIEYAAQLVLGQIISATVAYAVLCRQLDAVVALKRMTVRSWNDEGYEPLLVHHLLRYSRLLGGGAGETYEYYRERLQASSLLEEYPLLRDSRERCLADGDYLLALLAAALGQRSPWSQAAMSSDWDPPRRFKRQFVDDPGGRAQLTELFALQPSSLDAVLEAAHGQLADGQWSDKPVGLFSQE